MSNYLVCFSIYVDFFRSFPSLHWVTAKRNLGEGLHFQDPCCAQITRERYIVNYLINRLLGAALFTQKRLSLSPTTRSHLPAITILNKDVLKM